MNLERDPDRFAPVFVLGPARSFTSVVTSMIGAHPDLYGLPELKLFAYPTIGELAASLPASARSKGIAHRSPGLVRAIAELRFGSQQSEALQAGLRWLAERPSWTGAQVLDTIQVSVSPRRAVEKSPEHADSDAALRRLATAYPLARFIHLTRHPATTMRSMHDHWLRNVPGGPSGELRRACTDAWTQAHARLLEFALSVPERRYRQVRAEDVLNEPGEHLSRIARWLGASDSWPAIACMEHPERSPYARFAPAGSGVRGGNDPAFLADPAPRRAFLPSGIGPPEGWEPVGWGRVEGLAAQLGY